MTDRHLIALALTVLLVSLIGILIWRWRYNSPQQKYVRDQARYRKSAHARALAKLTDSEDGGRT